MPDYANALERKNWEKHGERPSVKDYGAKGDCIFLSDAGITAAAATLTSAAAAFTSADVGKAAWVEGAGAAGADLLTTIATYTDPNTVELTAAASTTVSSAKARYGTDDTAAIQLALDEGASRGWTIRFPRGAYLTTAALVPNHSTTITGEGFEEVMASESKVASQIVCCAAVAAIDYNTASPRIESFTVERIGIRGTSATGSKGIHILNCVGISIRHVSLDYFGDHAIHIEAGTDGYLNRIFCQNCMLVRSGRGAEVGVVDVLIHDVVMDYVIATSSVAAIGDGYIAGIAVRGVNGFYQTCIGHISEIGFYVGSAASKSTFVHCRADLAYGHGWVIDGNVNIFLGCRAHSNSMETTETYHAFLVNGAGNQCANCLVTYNGPSFNQHDDAFRTTNANTTAANHFADNVIQPLSYTGIDYNFTGTQTAQSVTYQSSTELPGSRSRTIRGNLLVREEGLIVAQSENVDVGADEKFWAWKHVYSATAKQWGLFLLADDLLDENPMMLFNRTGILANYVRLYAPAFFLRDVNAPADEKEWVWRVNRGVGYNQFLLALRNDVGAENVAIRIDRDGGYTPNYVEFPLGEVRVTKDLRCDQKIRLGPGQASSNTTTGLAFLEIGDATNGFARVLVYQGSPEGNLVAGPGSLCMDQSGPGLWFKASGTGNTGWGQLANLWTTIDANTIGTEFQVQLIDDGNSRPIQLTIQGNDHASQDWLQRWRKEVSGVKTTTAQINELGNLEAQQGLIDSQDDSQPTTFIVTPSAHAGQTEGATFVRFGTTSDFTCSKSGRVRVRRLGVGVAPPAGDGDLTIGGDAIIDGLTASLPTKTDASKKLVSAKIDLGASEDIAGTGLTDTQILYWDSASGTVKSKALTIADITSLQTSLDQKANKTGAGVGSHSHSFSGTAIPTHDHAGAVNPDGGHTPDGSISND